MTQKTFFADFWQKIEQDWAEQVKKEEIYGMGSCDFCGEDSCEGCPDNPDDTEYCDYTGEQCIGNKMFCEECPIFTGEDER